MIPARLALGPDHTQDQIFPAAAWSMQSYRANRASTKWWANIRRQTGKNLQRHHQYERRKFLPLRGTSLIVDLTFHAKAWSAIYCFSRQQRQRACPDRNNRVSGSIPRVSEAPIASHGAGSAPFFGGDKFPRRRISQARWHLPGFEKFAGHRGLHRRDATERIRQ